MRIHCLVFCLLTIVNSLLAQEHPVNTIKVTGSAQQTVIPDEIYALISLQEYNEKGAKVEMQFIENELVKIAESNGIGIENIEVENINGYQSYDYGSGILFSKSYRVKARDIASIQKVAKGVNEKSLTSVTITSFGYSDEEIKRLEKDLRKEALIDARDEAEQVAAELGKEIVDVTYLEITPSTDYYSYSEPYESPVSGSSQTPEAKYLSISYYVTATYSFR